MRNISSDTQLENGLRQMFPEPSVSFANRLEEQLLQQAALQQVPARRTRQKTFRLPGRMTTAWRVAAAVAVLVLVIVAAVGPQNVLAAVQKLLGYVPGIGFVENPQQAMRVLAEPVRVERDGVTLTVEKMLADSTSTLVRIRVDGVPLDKSLFEQGWGESSHPMLREETRNAAPQAGKTLVSQSSISGAGEFIWAEYTFPALSAGVDRVTLLLDRLPGLKAGAGPENWSVELPLQEVKSGDGIVAATAQPRVSAQVAGAQLVIESIASTQDQTALKVRLASGNPQRKADSEWWQGLVLMDDQGKALPLAREQTLRGTNDGSIVMLAPALDLHRSYTLQVEEARFETIFTPAEPAPGFRLAVPAGVQIGQSWQVDQTLEVAGYQLHITQASLQAGAVEGIVLQLTIDPQAGLVGVGLTCQNLDVCSSSGFELAQADQPLTTEVYLDQLPARAIDLAPHMLMETASGPWKVTFQLAGGQ